MTWAFQGDKISHYLKPSLLLYCSHNFPLKKLIGKEFLTIWKMRFLVIATRLIYSLVSIVFPAISKRYNLLMNYIRIKFFEEVCLISPFDIKRAINFFCNLSGS